VPPNTFAMDDNGKFKLFYTIHHWRRIHCEVRRSAPPRHLAHTFQTRTFNHMHRGQGAHPCCAATHHHHILHHPSPIIVRNPASSHGKSNLVDGHHVRRRALRRVRHEHGQHAENLVWREVSGGAALEERVQRGGLAPQFRHVTREE